MDYQLSLRLDYLMKAQQRSHFHHHLTSLNKVFLNSEYFHLEMNNNNNSNNHNAKKSTPSLEISEPSSSLPDLTPILDFDNGSAKSPSVKNVGQKSTLTKGLSKILEKKGPNKVFQKSPTRNDQNAQDSGPISSKSIKDSREIVSKVFEENQRQTPFLLFQSFVDELTGNPSDKKKLGPFLSLIQSSLSKTLHAIMTLDRDQMTNPGEFRRQVVPLLSSLINPSPRSLTGMTNMMPPYEKNFEEIENIGKGGFGSVKKARHRLDGCFYAIKIIPIPDDADEKSLREVIHLAKLDHKNIVSYNTSWLQIYDPKNINDYDENLNKNPENLAHDDYDDELELTENTFKRSKNDSRNQNIKSKFYRSSDSSASSSSSSSSSSSIKRCQKGLTLFIQMELCGKSLDKYLEKRDSCSVPEVLNIFKQILSGVQFIHEKKLIHRDLKPKNILFSLDEKCVKIADFGLAINQLYQSTRPLASAMDDSNNSSSDSSTLSIGLGTSVYAAPEQKSKQGRKAKYDHRVDIYSLGIILFELFYLMNTKAEKSRCLDNLKQSRKLPEDFPLESNHIKKLVIEMTENNPSRRSKNVKEVLKKIEKFQPKSSQKGKGGLVKKINRLKQEKKEMKETIAKLEREKNEKRIE